MCTGTFGFLSLSFSAKAQLQSTRRAFATARRRRLGGSHLYGRPMRTMRGSISLAAAVESAVVLAARRHGPARSAASSARRHPKDASPRALLRYRSRRMTTKVAAAASDDAFDEGERVGFSVASRVACLRAPHDGPLAPPRPRTARSFSSPVCNSFSDVCPTVTTTRQRKGRSELARARDAAVPISPRRCPSHARPVTTTRRPVTTRRASERFSIRVGASLRRRLRGRERRRDARVLDCFPLPLLTPTHATRTHDTHDTTPHDRRRRLGRPHRKLGRSRLSVLDARRAASRRDALRRGVTKA